MIFPELKRLHSPDLFDLNAHSFAEGAPFCILIQAMFGEKGIEGEESFDLLVCNPPWVEQRSRGGAFSGRHLLIVPQFEVDKIREFLDSIARNSASPTWGEVADKIGRYAKWEFEDYIE